MNTRRQGYFPFAPFRLGSVFARILLCAIVFMTAFHRGGAQIPDESSVGNTIWEFEPTRGLIVPRSGLFVSPDGGWYSLARTTAPLAYGGKCGYRVTSSNTAVLTLGVDTPNPGQIKLTFGSSTAGSYEDSIGSGNFRVMRVPVAQDVPLRNISSRATLIAGQSVSSGFVVKGNAIREVLVRAVGPSLAQFSVTNPAPSPRLIVWRREVRLGTNQGWNGLVSISQASARVGAFPLLAGSRDSALLLSLPPGDYIAQVDSGDPGGEVLVEVYFLN